MGIVSDAMCFNFAVPGVLCGLAGGTWDARLQVMTSLGLWSHFSLFRISKHLVLICHCPLDLSALLEKTVQSARSARSARPARSAMPSEVGLFGPWIGCLEVRCHSYTVVELSI